MGLAYLRHLEQVGTPAELVEIIGLSPGSPPERPHPPGEGPGGGEPPSIWVPVFPTNPIQLPPWAGKPQPPLPGTGPVVMPAAVLFEPPEGITIPPPIEGTPADYKPYVVWFGKGTLPTVAYVPPYASTGPLPEEATKK